MLGQKYEELGRIYYEKYGLDFVSIPLISKLYNAHKALSRYLDKANFSENKMQAWENAVLLLFPEGSYIRNGTFNQLIATRKQCLYRSVGFCQYARYLHLKNSARTFFYLPMANNRVVNIPFMSYVNLPHFWCNCFNFGAEEIYMAEFYLVGKTHKVRLPYMVKRPSFLIGNMFEQVGGYARNCEDPYLIRELEEAMFDFWKLIRWLPKFADSQLSKSVGEPFWYNKQFLDKLIENYF